MRWWTFYNLPKCILVRLIRLYNISFELFSYRLGILMSHWMLAKCAVRVFVSEGEITFHHQTLQKTVFMFMQLISLLPLISWLEKPGKRGNSVFFSLTLFPFQISLERKIILNEPNRCTVLYFVVNESREKNGTSLEREQ